ncbi:MAG TPA: lipoprotein insertase outer membrane protein LolB [Burkholderiaceae bacterium]|nr:lipoprotein insertase outer membrane protein LolB [Burkholderiaceae bacterium]
MSYATLKHSAGRLCAYIALLLPLFIFGCASVQRSPNAGGGAIQPHAYSETVDISGRFSAQFQHGAKPESWSGNFTWAQTPQATTVALQSPLGQTLATIVIDDTAATLTQPDQAPRRAANVDALVQDALGWPLPISNLRDWLQAYAVDTGGKRVLITPTSTATIATHDGWQINYINWQDDNDTGMRDVPKRIDMERETAAAGKVAMRLVITSWQAR